jgi:signal transduction histidine kinase
MVEGSEFTPRRRKMFDSRSVVAGVFLIALLFGFTWAPELSAEDREVRVGVYENEPKIYTNSSGKPSGIFIDVIEDIAQKEHWRITYVHGEWDECLRRLSHGEIDLMPDVALTEEREALYSFHKIPVLSSWSQVFARRDRGIQSILDLSGKRVAVLKGSIQQRAFLAFARGFDLSIDILEFTSYERAFRAVAEDRADAVVTNNLYGLAHARKMGLEDTAVVFNPASLYYAAPLGRNPDLLDAVDYRMQQMKSDPGSVYYRTLRRWTEESVPYRIPMWLRALGLVIAVALIVSLFESLALKRQVDLRTRELQRSNHEMEERIIRRTAELASAMEQAQEADRIKTAFLATMSHELRTPLNSIIGFTGILLQELAGSLNDEQKKQLRMVQTSSRHLLSLINDVLDISKIEAGQMNILKAPFDLFQSMEKLVKSVTPFAEKKGIDLTLDCPPDIGTIFTDQRHLEQVTLNLLNNAIKFTESGEVRMACRREGDNGVIAVTDTGIGMKPEEMKRLFLPFQQIDTGLTRKYEGTGLGLSISRRLVELMGGDITVESDFGKGSTFTITIPVKGEPEK